MNAIYIQSLIKSYINKKNILKATQFVFVLLFLIPLYNYSTSVAFGIDYFVYTETPTNNLSTMHQNSFYTDLGDESFSININWIYGDITITQYQGELTDPIIVQEFSEDTLDKSHEMNAVYDSQSLDINWANTDFYSENSDAFQTKNLSISIPSAISITACTINSSITDISMSDLTVGEFTFNAKESNLELFNFNTENLTIGINEGDILMNTVLCDLVYINSGNAATSLSYLSTETLYFLSNTGNFSFIGNAESFNVKTIYGNVSVKSSCSASSVLFENLFGETSVKVPDTSNFIYSELNFNGEIELTGFDLETVLNENDEPELYYYVREDSSNSYTLSTTSGSISLSKSGEHQDFDTYSEWLNTLSVETTEDTEEESTGETASEE
ncbi:MAG: DUF4097 family beta strand repeat-containing protein [Clostridia bacterium]